MVNNKLKMMRIPDGDGMYMQKDSHSQNLLLDLNKNRSTNHRCDVSFRVDNNTVYAHRAVLAQSSEYFDGLLFGNYIEKNQDVVDLTDSFESAELLETLIRYMYIGSVRLDADNYETILAGASLLMLNEVIQSCEDFMIINLLNVSNCLRMWALAEKYSLQKLMVDCKKIISCRLHDTVLFSEDSLNVTCDFLIYMFSYHHTTQHVVYLDFLEFLERWLDHDREVRERDLINILTDPNIIDRFVADLKSEQDFISADIEGDFILKKLLKKARNSSKFADDETEIILFEGEDLAYIAVQNRWVTLPDLFSKVKPPKKTVLPFRYPEIVGFLNENQLVLRDAHAADVCIVDLTSGVDKQCNAMTAMDLFGIINISSEIFTYNKQVYMSVLSSSTAERFSDAGTAMSALSWKLFYIDEKSEWKLTASIRLGEIPAVVRGGMGEEERVTQQVLHEGDSISVVVQVKRVDENEFNHRLSGLVILHLIQSTSDNIWILSNSIELVQSEYCSHHVCTSLHGDVYRMQTNTCRITEVNQDLLQIKALDLIDNPGVNLLDAQRSSIPSCEVDIQLYSKSIQCLLLPSLNLGKVFQIRKCSPILTEMWCFDVVTWKWSSVRPPLLKHIDIRKGHVIRCPVSILVKAKAFKCDDDQQLSQIASRKPPLFQRFLFRKSHGKYNEHECKKDCLLSQYLEDFESEAGSDYESDSSDW